MKQIRNPTVLNVINKAFPQGRTLSDFVKALLLLPVVNTIKVSLVATKETVTDQLQNYLNSAVLHLAQLVGQLISQGFNSISSVLTILKLSNAAFFDVLNMLNAKLLAAPRGTTQRNAQAAATGVTESIDYRFNMALYLPRA